MIDIEPVSIAQIARGRGGNLVAIDNDVCDIAKQIKVINPDFFLRYNEQGEYFVVLQDMGPNFRPHPVTMSPACDQRLVERVRYVCSDSYDPVADMERSQDEADRTNNDRFTENIGEVSEKLAWAIREDIRKARPGPVYIPPDILPNRRFRK